MAETLTYDNAPDSEVLTEEEQDSLAVGEELMAEQENLLAGKYKNAEELENAYLELQKKLGEASDEPEEEGEMEEQEEVEIDPATDMLTAASTEFAETGEITQETFDQLAEMDSADLLAAYMNLQEGNPAPAQAADLTDADVNELKASVGGEEAYDQITNWAADALSDAELDAFNATIENGSLAQIQMIMAGLQARYQAVNGYEGRQLQGKPPSSSGDAFRSQAEVVEAISDPRYDRDPAYRNDVLMRLERSDISF
ncbi:capsid assembly protein [Synechococcus T7-like phage S-TIP37]|uniref:Capsid assembly protein n=1 Tax=Synechococcus T7-like phage S-TIP37 TaxID=1332145 RepID=A0A345AYA6_9CAUD|nr:head assembly [Synechococcus T7-like phage S-TIP37]AXF42086.1 capsid assembly protein [Synechococcus T7-like phage S-TIP37]